MDELWMHEPQLICPYDEVALRHDDQFRLGAHLIRIPREHY